MVLGLMGGDVSKNVKADDWGGGDGGTGDDIGRTVGGVEEGVVFRVVKNRPSELGGWGTGDKRSRCWGSICVKIGTQEVPSIVVGLENFKDGSSSVRNVLLIDIVKGGPESDRDVGEGGGGDDGGLRRSERHSILN